ncbi:30S ribosomal protein S8 [Candidatus Bipolaricaulota bacterium]|nr:30S ribosomal protein S8 [Candidatus Bipolaricaulota bacterium]MBS3813819.1 30S ribosomal protein S8 [Candidatus Bipolaricaulota bacterium]MBS3824938.1 30S ribosomal protein S8 [Candidatus Bipolaricaulota bacterium]
MTTQDPISDMITRIRNASRRGHDVVSLPGSTLKESIAQVLLREGYISDYEVEELPAGKKNLNLSLSYKKGKAVIEGIERESKPSGRVYVSKDEIPMVLGGLGTAVLSTSKGLMTGKDAREEEVGGELLLKVW